MIYDDPREAIRQVTWSGLVANIVLATFKVVAGYIGGSQAVVADGVHSISDVTTDLAVLIGVEFWSAPPDAGHPHGHQRIETTITALIGIVLAIVAVGMATQAIGSLRIRQSMPPSGIALTAAVASIIVKEAIYRWTLQVGRRTGSKAVIANAWHHRSDALSSIPAALAVGGAILMPAWTILDAVGAVIVSIFILQAAWKITWPALMELADAGAPPEVLHDIRVLALQTDGVLDVHKIRTRQVGNGLQVDLHVLVDASLTVREGHQIGGRVRQRLIQQGPDINDVIVHLEPYDLPPPSIPPELRR